MTDFEKNPELEEELEVNVITLTDDETGEEQDFEIWAQATIDEQLYYALVPVEDDGNDGDTSVIPTEPASKPAQGTTEDEPETKPTKPVKSNVAEPLTWEKLNAIPVANASMSTDELRKICTDFMRLQLSLLLSLLHLR